MKKILIYGDSNVWGDNFLTGQRIPDEKQWVNILRKDLGPNYLIFQEGLPARLAGNDEKEKKHKNGKDSFLAIFRTNAPLDILVIALGTNDLQIKYNKSSESIINDLLWYTNIIKESFADLEDRQKYFVNNRLPQIYYLLPPNFDYQNNAKDVLNAESEQKRQEIIKYFQKNVANSIIVDNLPLFNDGIHLNYEGHQKVADIVKEVLVSNEK